MIVYIVLQHVDYEGDTLFHVTTDEHEAIEKAKSIATTLCNDCYAYVEKWDATTDEVDRLYENQYWGEK